MQWKVLAGLRFFLAWIVVCYHLKNFIPDYGKDFLCTFGKLNGLATVLGFLLISG
jgi:peptidoglycan/LPS O-acetylase OafA/YrhL